NHLFVRDSSFDNIRTSGKFIRVNLTVKNLSNRTGNLFYSKFDLLDSSGRKYNTVNFLDKEGLNFLAYQNEQGLGKMRSDMFPG
ncbi:hypothetical protein R0J92_24870, partial [Tritonibacter sp. SIMBA_163]